MKLVATVLAAAAAAAVAEAAPAFEGVFVRTEAPGQYWWRYPGSDCGYDDVAPQPACGVASKGNVPALEACCLATAGCGGYVLSRRWW